MKNIKKRLDILLHEQMLQYSRQQIQSWIMQGRVQVDGRVIDKAGTIIKPDAHITMDLEEPKYVSRAGFKLEKALDAFVINVHGMVVMDAGLSTGGFTDCLLQHGAAKVYGIDVGYGQVHEKIRNDARVVVMERTNLREVRELPEGADLVTLDLSFISVLKVMDALCAVLKPDGKLVVLIKPQFEAGKEEVDRGAGIIKDSVIHKRVVQEIQHAIEQRGFVCIGIIESPILGGSGNKEFIAYFQRRAK